MSQLIPVEINRPKPYVLYASWADGFESMISLAAFREECPCAECKGESMKGLNGQVLHFPGMKQFKAGMNELTKLDPVGNYAVSAEWGDGHDSGIYTWDIFRKIFEKHKLTPEKLVELDRKMSK